MVRKYVFFSYGRIVLLIFISSLTFFNDLLSIGIGEVTASIQVNTIVATNPTVRMPSDKPGSGIYMQAHDVRFTGKLHSLVKVVPKNQSKWMSKGSVKKDSSGNYFFTLGAGPYNGKLKSDFNRPRDVYANKVYSERLMVPAGMDEDALISKIIMADKGYADDLVYSALPDFDSREYNSNSYAMGLVLESGMQPSSFAISDRDRLPGIEKPVPHRYFGGK